MAFATAETTVYAIRPGRGCGDVATILGEEFAGVLTREASALFRFLGDPAIDATHWRAEHAIRPAVVMRKVCGGHRNARGAQTQPVLASALRTAHLRGLDPSPILVALVRPPGPSVVGQFADVATPDRGGRPNGRTDKRP